MAERALGHLKELGGIKATLLTLSVGGVVAILGKLLSDNESWIAGRLNLPSGTVHGVALAFCLAIAGVIVVREWDRIARQEVMPDPGAVFDDEELVAVDRRTPALGKAIEKVLIPQLFPSALNQSGSETMPFEEIERAGQLNRFMAVGVYSRRDEKFVGYASFWPVRDEIGEALKAGRMTDSQLTAEHIVPEGERRSCRYAIIPGIGVIGDNQQERVRRALRLQRALRQMIAREYLTGRKGAMTIIATAYSKHGRKWCTHYQMSETGKADYGDGVLVPVCARQIKLADLI
ncbi:MAG: hypothetical protein EOP60_08195 [Sphingomonadales bacterium]|nr:MAG: hypothetical protein EOP60_08195 [Sphingomonadales bacterium]